MNKSGKPCSCCTRMTVFDHIGEAMRSLYYLATYPLAVIMDWVRV